MGLTFVMSQHTTTRQGLSRDKKYITNDHIEVTFLTSRRQPAKLNDEIESDLVEFSGLLLLF